MRLHRSKSVRIASAACLVVLVVAATPQTAAAEDDGESVDSSAIPEATEALAASTESHETSLDRLAEVVALHASLSRGLAMADEMFALGPGSHAFEHDATGDTAASPAGGDAVVDVEAARQARDDAHAQDVLRDERFAQFERRRSTTTDVRLLDGQHGDLHLEAEYDPESDARWLGRALSPNVRTPATRSGQVGLRLRGSFLEGRLDASASYGAKHGSSSPNTVAVAYRVLSKASTFADTKVGVTATARHELTLPSPDHSGAAHFRALTEVILRGHVGDLGVGVRTSFRNDGGFVYAADTRTAGIATDLSLPLTMVSRPLKEARGITFKPTLYYSARRSRIDHGGAKAATPTKHYASDRLGLGVEGKRWSLSYWASQSDYEQGSYSSSRWTSRSVSHDVSLALHASRSLYASVDLGWEHTDEDGQDLEETRHALTLSWKPRPGSRLGLTVSDSAGRDVEAGTVERSATVRTTFETSLDFIASKLHEGRLIIQHGLDVASSGLGGYADVGAIGGWSLSCNVEFPFP
jgi:hypothetical protein